jgi:hypothetical protein
MTTPDERTKAVLDTRDLLNLLAASPNVTIPGLVQSVAMSLLRHYPLTIDLDISASELPTVWAHPSTRGRVEKQRTRSLIVPLNRTQRERE